MLLVPDDEVKWLDHSEDRLELRRCAYWINLESLGPTTNQASVTIRVPRSQQFTASTLKGLLVTIGSTGEL